MQLVFVDDLPVALAQYMDPDAELGTDGKYQGRFGEEIEEYIRLLSEELAKVPQVTQVLFWDQEDGGDPRLDLSTDWYVRRELVPTPPPAEGVYIVEQCPGARWNKARDSYYGASFYQRNWFPVGQFVISLWFGGDPMASASGFYVIPVA
jgi:hypothetical protein